MPSFPLALPPQSNRGEQPHAGVASLINCYAVPEGEEQRSKLRIRAASGLDAVATVATTGGVRRMLEVDGVINAVVGRSIYQIDAGGSDVLIGGMPSDGYVGMARNQRATGVQTVVVCDWLARSIVGGTLTSITDSDLLPAIDVCVINRRAIYCSADGRMIASEIDDVTSIDALDAARAEAVPDGLLRIIDRGSDLIAIGPRSMEVWTDTGGELFGFSRANVVTVGAVGANAVTKATVLGQILTDTVAWCATDREGRYAGVVLLSGYTPQKISTAYIDRLVDAVSDKTTIVAMSWVERGRAMIAWRLTSTTVVYDTSTGLWHERQSRDALGNLTAWDIACTAVLGGRVMAGHVSDPAFHWLDPDVFDDDGDEIIMRVRCPPISAYPGRIEMSRLYLDMIPGVGLGSGSAQDTAPQVTLRLSRDGETWGNERTAALGAQGQRGTRVMWSRLGTHPQVTPEFTCSAAVVREILQASWDGMVLPP